MTDESLRIAFAEIVEGSTPSFQKDHGVFYIKHPTYIELSKNYQFYKKILDLAISKELPTTETREKQIIEDGSWSEDKTKRIKELSDYIQNLKQTKAKLFQKVEKDTIDKQIRASDAEYHELVLTKQILIGSTAEIFAMKKLNEHFIFNSIYKDELCKTKLFSEEDYDDLDEYSVSEFIGIYTKEIEKFSSYMVKKIALSSFFFVGFNICDDNPVTYFGKPVISLTANQIDLFGQGIYFKNIIQHGGDKIPKEVMSDPDKLIDWVSKTNVIKEMANAADQNLDKNNRESAGGGFSIVGASQEDLQNAGIVDDIGAQFAKEAKEKGGILSFEDIIRIQAREKV